MSYIKGKFKNAIFESDTGYKVGLFRVKETDDSDIEANEVTVAASKLYYINDKVAIAFFKAA